jgi:3-keto-5-aminohexanoate cleavage enzyme
MSNVPIIMAAPNGARKTKEDHPNLPITIAETVEEAMRCFDAGASVLHAHVRDEDGKHSLDTASYGKLIENMHKALPNMLVQITTESAGVFTPADQARCLMEVKPDFASVAVREMMGTGSVADLDFARETYAKASEQGTAIQHIVYAPNDLEELLRLKTEGILPNRPLHALFVLGRYNPGFISDPEELDMFLAHPLEALSSWMVCAFGPSEYDSMIKTIGHGGQARIGFENNIYLKDGSIAENTASLIKQITDHQAVASSEDAYRALT